MSDVIIIGGGPAGSAMGAYLSKAGISNLIIEKAIHPRPHVGESMVPASTKIFLELEFLHVMERAGFVHKYGAAWHAPNGKEFSIAFPELPQPGVDQDYTYHVDRSQFDLLLLKHAESLGSTVIQGVTVKKVLFDGEQAKGVRVSVDGVEVDLSCKFVVDASGRNTLLGNQLKLKEKDPIFNQYAVHAWFEGVERGRKNQTSDFIHIYFLPIERGWVWQIPITDTITSVGVVADKNVLKEFHQDLDAYFQMGMQSNPDLSLAMRNAVRVNEYKSEGDYSYKMSRFIGNGYLCVGDAVRFVDPIFSSGVSVAFYSAKFASECIGVAFESGNFSESVLQPYDAKLRSGVSVWYEFIRLYYKLLPLFTHFIQSKQHRVEVHRLLQGDVYERGEVGVLDAMRKYIAAVEHSDHHLLRGQLSTIPLD